MRPLHPAELSSVLSWITPVRVPGFSPLGTPSKKKVPDPDLENWEGLLLLLPRQAAAVEELENGPEVEVTLAVGLEHRVDGVRGRGQGDGGLDGTRGLGREEQILLHEGVSEASLVAPARRYALQNPRAWVVRVAGPAPPRRRVHHPW